MPNLTVIARFQAKPGMEEQFKQDLGAMVAPSRQDEGNIDYDVLQSNDDPAVFFTYENWTGKAALDKHMQTPHFKDLDRKSKETLAQPMDVQLLNDYSDGA
jgi:quinol monooxygenase YgiN